MKGETTLKELAKIANLSANTVSKALNDRPGVNAQTRIFVKRLAEEYHYRPNMMARTMRGAANNLVGALLSDISDSFFVELLSGVEEETTLAAMPILIGNSCESIEKQNECLDCFLSYHCKNIIITPVAGDTSFISMLEREGVNFVIADRVIPEAKGCNQVCINIRRDAYRATEYLIEQGHRRIAMINQKSVIFTETERNEGYKDALRAYGIPVREEYIYNTQDTAEIAAACERLMRGECPPTALFIAKDKLAIDVVSALYRLGVRIPEDLSVFIYGKPDWSQSLRPYFTCMERSVKDIGSASARILIDRLNGAGTIGAPVHIAFDSRLIIRDSVKKL